MTRASLAAALAVCACSFAPKYERPDAGVPAEFRFAQPGESASVADLPWWELFRDPVLQGLIQEALAKNQDLALAVARVDEARAMVGVARADLYPQVAATANAGYGRASKKVDPLAVSTGHFAIAADVSWELDLWGRVRNARDAAQADLLATEDGRRAVVLALVSGTAQAYLELRELDLELAIARENADTRRATLDLFEKRSKGGVGSDLEVNQARADLAVTLAAIPETEMAIAAKEHEICILLGRAPGPIPRGVALVDTAAPPQLPSGVPTQLLARRPDVLAAEQGIIAAGHRVGVAVANRFPTISLAGFIGLQATSVPDLFASDAAAGDVGGSLFAPIFEGGRLSALEDAARALLQQSIAVYRKTVEQALREVADAAVGVRMLRDARASRQDQVKASEAANRLATHRYEGGVSSYLEVLDAQRQLYDAQLTLARTQRDELTSAVQLYRALGGGWQAQEAAATPGAAPGPAPAGAPPPPPAAPPPPPQS